MTKEQLISYIEENVYENNNKEVTALNVQNSLKEVVDFVPDITTLQGDVSTAENDIATLQGVVNTAENDIATLQGVVNTARNDIATLQGVVESEQDGINDLQDYVAIARNDITTLQNTVNELEISEYTPAISNIVGAFTANPAIIKAFYIKMGNYVKCEVLFSYQASSTGTKGFELSLPIASNFSNIRDVVGFGITNTATTASAIANYYLSAETTNKTIKIQFFISATQAYEASLSFIYKII